MGELKVVAMDMDGTLLTASQDILPYTRKVLMQLQQQGVSLLLAILIVYKKLDRN